MAAELSFGRIIRTSVRAQPHFPLIMVTVEQSLDYLQELPLATLDENHWRAASEALWNAVDYPDNAARLVAADRALCMALATEGWLNEVPPA